MHDRAMTPNVDPRRRQLLAALAAGAALPALPARADGLPPPDGPPLLTVTGLISRTNDGAQAVFDLAMLAALGTVTYRTSTIWTQGEQSFTGVPVRQLLDTVGASGSTIEASAINDYLIDIPVAELAADAPIIAYLQNGRPMSVRDKGPLWVVYPYDSRTEYQSETAYARSIWQLARMDILP